MRKRIPRADNNEGPRNDRPQRSDRSSGYDKSGPTREGGRSTRPDSGKNESRERPSGGSYERRPYGDRPKRDDAGRSQSERPKRSYGRSEDRGKGPGAGAAHRYEPREVPRGEDGRPSRGGARSESGDRGEKKPFDREGGKRPYNREDKSFGSGEKKPFERKSYDNRGESGKFSRDKSRPVGKAREHADGTETPAREGRESRDFEDRSGARGERPQRASRDERDERPRAVDKENASAAGSEGEGSETGHNDIAQAAAAYRAAKRAGKGGAKSDKPAPPLRGSKEGDKREFASRGEKGSPREDDRGDTPPADRSERKPYNSDRKPYDREKKPYSDERRPFAKRDDVKSKSFAKPERAAGEDAGTGYVKREKAPKKHDHPEERREKTDDSKGPMTLNKYLAHSGVSSRRTAAVMIKDGKVSVNGEIKTEPGYRVQAADIVTMEGETMTPQRHFVYILLNKPKGFLTTTSDDRGRRTVLELVADAAEGRIYPIGRLDQNTTGVLLLTNDGEFADKLSHPKYEVKKVYQATLDKNITDADLDKLVTGIELEDGMAMANEAAILENKNEVGLELHSGKNRIVRRLFEALGYSVERLDRVSFAGLTKKNVSRGQWRFLTERELVLLKHFKA